MERPPQQLLDAIRRGSRFLVIGHIDPDPDSTGSVLAMQRLLGALGKEAVAVTPNPLPPTVRFLPGSDAMLLPEAVDPDSWEDLIVVDCGTERIGAAVSFVPNARTIINIDHHPTNPGSGHCNWINPRFAATAQMVYTLYQELQVSIDRDVALLIYTGLAGDTGTFRYSNTTADVLRIAASLVEKGVRPGEVTEQLYEQHSLGYLRLLRMVFDTIATAYDDRVIYAKLTPRMKETADVRPEEVNGIIQYLRLVRSADVAFLLEEIGDNQVKVQFRSSAAVDVSEVARALGGGGHPRAAGCRLALDLASAERRVLQEIGRALPGVDR